MTGRRLAYLTLETPHEGQASHTHVHEIIDGLRGLGWEVELFATRQGGASSGTSYLKRLRDYANAQWRLARALRRHDAVYMRAHFAALPVSLWAKLRGRPVIQEINGLPADIFVTYPWLGRLAWFVTASYRWQMKLAAHVVVVTDGLRAWAQAQSGHSSISVVSNGANTRVFSPEGPRPDAAGAYIAFVGGITAWHGIDVMVEATRDPAWPADMRLVIIGDGRESGQLRAAMERDAGKRITWLGRLPQEHAAMWLRGALGALSITQDRSGEAQGHLGAGVAPLKLFEAMASGAAVIVTDLPFQADLVRAQSAGLVIPMNDAHALACAVASLAAHPAEARRLGANGAAFVRAHASWTRRAAEVSDQLERIAGPRKTR